LIIDHLEGIQANLRTAQYELDQLYNKQKLECDEELAHRNQAVKDGEDSFKRSQAHLQRCESSLLYNKAKLTQFNGYLEEVKNMIDQATKVREQERINFKNLIENQLNPALAAVQEAYPIISSYETEAGSFIQMSDTVTRVFTKLMPMGKAESMTPIIMTFVEMQAGQFSSGDLQNVRSLFQNLESDL
jgi:hypothetical protein